MSLTDGGPYPKDVTKCRACEVDIVFVKTKRGKWMPVNVVPTESKFRGPTAGELKFKYGEHEPHWSTCTEAHVFRTGE